MNYFCLAVTSVFQDLLRSRLKARVTEMTWESTVADVFDSDIRLMDGLQQGLALPQ